MRRPVGLRVGAVLLGSVLLVGCGASSTSSSDLSASAASVLGKDADSLASAARAGNVAAVSAALGTLRRDVAAQRGSGDVSESRAQRILGAAAVLARDVAPPAMPTPSGTERKEEGKDHGERKGKG